MVTLDGEVDAVGDEGRGVAEEVDIFVDLLDDFEGEFADEGAVGDEEDGDFFVAAADGAEDGERRSFGEMILAFEVPVQKDCAVRRVGGDQRQAVLRGGGSDDLVAFETDCLDQPLHGTVRYRIRPTNFTRNQQNPTPFAHEPLTSSLSYSDLPSDILTVWACYDLLRASSTRKKGTTALFKQSRAGFECDFSISQPSADPITVKRINTALFQ